MSDKLDATIEHALFPWVRPDQLHIVVNAMRKDLLAAGGIEWHKKPNAAEMERGLWIPLPVGVACGNAKKDTP